jgi:hypothetical protein
MHAVSVAPVHCRHFTRIVAISTSQNAVAIERPLPWNMSAAFPLQGIHDYRAPGVNDIVFSGITIVAASPVYQG